MLTDDGEHVTNPEAKTEGQVTEKTQALVSLATNVL